MSGRIIYLFHTNKGKYILTEGLMCYLAHGALNYWLTTIQLTNTEQTALTRQCRTSLNTICSAGPFSVPLCYKSTPKFTIKSNRDSLSSKMWGHLSQTFTSIPFGFISPVKNKLLIYTLLHAYKSINVSSPPPLSVALQLNYSPINVLETLTNW